MIPKVAPLILLVPLLTFPSGTDAVESARVVIPQHVTTGENVTMVCEFDLREDFDPKNLGVYWQCITDNKVESVCSYYNGTDSLEKQAPRFRNRTTLAVNPWRAILTLQNATLLDSGIFQCTIKYKWPASDSDVLSVSARYQPLQLTVRYEDGTAVLQCVTEGGFPLGKVIWYYQDGRRLNQTWSVMNYTRSDRTFLIKSTLTLKSEEETSVCCSVIHRALKENITSCLKIPGKRYKC
ncbi:CD276 antigen homolog [Protopterus annectens]|uniref:CD276 antigen homolog n=1 Tax=Protopterus annectens TaxID=7888 RepID=UPI001CFA5413|nr:CD276 antigen homolog [Protopterus annectens]